MKKRLTVSLILLTTGSCFNFIHAQTPPPDTISKIIVPSFADSVVELSLKLFTSNQRISSKERDDWVIRDLTGYLTKFRSFDITSVGALSQNRNLSLFGIPSGDLGIYYGDFFFNPASLTFPFQTRPELNYLPVENIESAQLVENPLLNLVYPDSKLGGIYLEEKDYRGGEPYTRLTFEQGMQGYRRTQVDFGRGIGRRIRFYGTLGFSKSGGDVPNTDQSLDNYSLKLSHDFDQKTQLVADAQVYSGKQGLVPFPGWDTLNLRREEGYQKLNLNFYRRLSANNVLKAGLDFARTRQEIKAANSESIDKVYGVHLDFYPQSLGRSNLKFSWNTEHYVYQDISSHPLQKDNFSFTNLFQATSRLWLLAWGNFQGADSTNSFTTNRKFSFLTSLAWEPWTTWRIYASAGRINIYPGLKDLYGPERTFPVNDTLPLYAESGNLKLQTGYLWYVQTGWDYEKNSLKLGSYFDLSRAKRAVTVSRTDTFSFGQWMPVNTDLNSYGGNFYLDLNLNSGFRVYANWNYKTWKDSDQPTFLPKSSLFSYLEVDKNFLKHELGWKARIEAEYIGMRKDLEGNQMDEVVVLNSKLTFRILAVNFYYIVENLTNQTYQSGSQFDMPKRTNWWGLFWEFFD